MALRWNIGLPGPFSVGGRVFPRVTLGTATGGGSGVALTVFLVAVWVSEGPVWVRVLLTVLASLAALGALAYALWQYGGAFIAGVFQATVWGSTLLIYGALTRLYLIEHSGLEPMWYEPWLVAHHAWQFLASGGWLILAVQLLAVFTLVPFTAGFITGAIPPLRDLKLR